MNIREIAIGTKLELEVLTNQDQKIGLTHMSQMIELIDSQNVAILCPIHESKYVFITLGTRVRIAFFHEKHNSLFFFTAVIRHKETKGNILLLYVNITSELQKLQRRNYFRFDCNLDAKYRIFVEENEVNVTGEKTIPPEFKNALTRNISGSGACIVIEEELLKSALLEVVIKLNENTSVSAKCKVIRVTEIAASKGKKYEIGLYFIKLTSKGQDDVIRFIFERQRETLKGKH